MDKDLLQQLIKQIEQQIAQMNELLESENLTEEEKENCLLQKERQEEELANLRLELEKILLEEKEENLVLEEVLGMNIEEI